LFAPDFSKISVFDFFIRSFFKGRSQQMPRGGSRVGAGRKPKGPPKPSVLRISAAIEGGRAAEVGNLVAFDGGRAGELGATPPADLPDDQHGFWRTYAPLAIDAGTLTPQTAGSFRLLCELDAEKAATKATLDKDGRTFIKVVVDGDGLAHGGEVKAHPLTGSYRQLAQRVEALMARFLLAPFGKPIAGSGKKKPTVSPWAAIAAAKR
jgi:hypothetical protein